MRGQGVGKALFGYLGKLCKDLELPRMDWVVLDWNTPAQDVYRRMGANHVSLLTLSIRRKFELTISDARNSFSFRLLCCLDSPPNPFGYDHKFDIEKGMVGNEVRGRSSRKTGTIDLQNIHRLGETTQSHTEKERDTSLEEDSEESSR